MGTAWLLAYRQHVTAEARKKAAAARKKVEDEEDVADVGHLAEGEVIGYVPARQLGGDDDNLQRVKALGYFGFLAQLEPYKVMELTPPEPGYPFGKFRFMRHAGPKPQ